MAWFDIRFTLAGGGSIKFESSFRDITEAEAFVENFMKRAGPVTIELQTERQSFTLSETCILAVLIKEQEEAGEYE